ncbi:hypothetical protein SCHPADRAFT_925657 [Schizopora paradoxa]|uniref:BTB domain-containing protein n=1 Tax=Schizopora paradoxa TaxID=27342 RepID=A0A0H2S1B3_9AGAM|nr:hypothetical protein SCHPADRAFT_925657 [Schizopora paradoxa]
MTGLPEVTTFQGTEEGSKRRGEDLPDSELECTPKRPKLEEDETEGKGEKRIQEFPPEPTSFEELLATQKQQKAALTAPADDSIDLDRDSSPEPDFAEMDHLLGRMRPSQSQTSSKSSQTRAGSKKPRSNVGNVAKSDSVSSSKPVSKQKSSQNSNASREKTASTSGKDKGVERDRPESTKTTSAAAKALRHETHWYLDGSVVVHMQNTIFRLHRSALVRKSDFFARLFEEMGDGARVEKMSGCPIVRVKGDPEDFAILLDALDDAVGLLSKAPPFATLAAILRASTTFEFTSMKEWAVSSLEQMWPNDLNSVTPISKVFAMESLQLARECDVKNVIKRVLYEIVRTGGFGLHSMEDEDEDEEEDEVVGDEAMEEDEGEGDGEDEEDEADSGEVDEEPEAADGNEEDKPIDQGNVPASNEAEDKGQNILPQDDVRKLIFARERLLSEWVLNAACAPKPMCQSGEKHKDDALLWAKLVHSSGLFEESLYDPLVGLSALANLEFPDEPYDNEGDLGVLGIDWVEEKWCPECAPRMEETFKKARTKIWQKLDVWFGLK